MLVLAAAGVHESGKVTFTAEDLVVAVWKMFPETFSLRGYVDGQSKPLYPDSNRVYMEIMGTKPIRKRGYLAKTGEKTYRLTDAGQSRAKEIQGYSTIRSSARAPDNRSLPRNQEAILDRLSRCSAVSKFSAGQQEQITFFDACVFWGISPRSNAKELWEHLARTRDTLSQAEIAYAGSGKVKVVLRMLELHELLCTRFEPEIKMIEKRKDERK
jgi:hypothetical protein